MPARRSIPRNGVCSLLAFHPGTDAKVAATRICQGYGILNWHCVDALTAQIAEASTAKAAAPAEGDAEEAPAAEEEAPKEGEFAFSEAELEADNAAYAKLQRKLAQEMDIRLLESGLRDWSYEPQPEQPAQ